LSISYDKENIVIDKPGLLVLNVRFYAQYSNPLYLATMVGKTETDYHNPELVHSHRYLCVGKKGGLSL